MSGGTGSDGKSLEDMFYQKEMELSKTAFTRQFTYGVVYAWVRLREQVSICPRAQCPIKTLTHSFVRKFATSLGSPNVSPRTRRTGSGITSASFDPAHGPVTRTGPPGVVARFQISNQPCHASHYHEL